jgi:hypothetical protein
VRSSTRGLHRIWLVALVSALCALGCSGPRDATPLPEPPALNPDRIGITVGLIPATTTIWITAAPNAAPANALVRVTNLESTGPTISTTAMANGSFEIRVPGEVGDELRFQALVGAERSPPIDLIYVNEAPTGFRMSARHSCVSLSPGFELLFASAGSQELTLRSTCAGTLSVANPRQRRPLAAFSLETALPLDVSAGGTGSLSVAFSGATAAEVEDTLFVDVTNDGVTLRYPITLAAP